MKHIRIFSIIFSLIFSFGTAFFSAFPVPAGAQSGTTDSGTGWTGGLQALKDESGLPQQTLKIITENLMGWMLAILGFIAIIGFIVAGFLYLTAAGNTKQIETAKTAMWYSILGVIVALLGYVVLQAVDLWLRGETGF